jgi:hypothetical protein
MTARIKGTSSSPFFDVVFAAQKGTRQKQSPYRPRRTRAKLDAVEALAQRWLAAGAFDHGYMREFGQELLDTLNNAGEPKP